MWPHAVLRGDYGTITIGVGYVHPGRHRHPRRTRLPHHHRRRLRRRAPAHLEGCTLEDESLAGSGSVVLHWAVISQGATVGANAVVPNNMVVPPGALALGVPAKIHEGRSDVRDDPAVGGRVRGQRQALPASLRRLD